MMWLLNWLLDTPFEELTAGQDWHLGLTADYGDYVTVGLLLALAAMVYLTIRSYRREGDAPRRVKGVLAGLRLAMIVLLFVILFQPAIVLRFVNVLHSSVVVLIDDSHSMSFQDPYDAPAARDVGRQIATAMKVSPARLETLSRRELAVRALGDPNSPLVALSKDHPLVFLAFSAEGAAGGPYVRPLGTVNLVRKDADQAPDPNAAARIAEVLEGLSAEGNETDHATAIRGAIEQTEGQRIEAFLVVGDGQETARGGRRRLDSALAYAGDRAGLYSLLVGDPTPQRNLAVTTLEAPREVRMGTATEFVAWLSHRNVKGSARVHLERREGDGSWQEVGVAETVELDDADEGDDDQKGGRRLQSVALKYTPSQIGSFEFRAVAEPLPDERNLADNAADALVSVAEKKTRVLLISGDSGWEFQYLRNYLVRQNELYRVSIWQQNLDKDIDQMASEGMKLASLPRDLPSLLGDPKDPAKPGYDVVILYDPQYTENGFDQHFVDKLLRPFVERHGGGLCYIAGNKYSERNLLTSGDAFDALAALLPVKLASDSVGLVHRLKAGEGPERPWPGRLTPYGADSPVMRLGPSVDASRQLWDVMPGLFWTHPVQRIKPAARVLLESSNPMFRTPENDPTPLLAVQPFGTGRVLYLGINATWRWRYVDDARYYERFWANAMQYLATLQARRVVITTGGDRFDVGEEIQLDATVYDKDFQPLTEESFPVTLIDANSDERSVYRLKAVDPNERPGQYRLTVQLPTQGRYRITALTDDPDAEGLVAGKEIRIEAPTAEAERPEADEQTLRTIASRSDYHFGLGALDRLPGRVDDGRRRSVRVDYEPLWDSKLALFLIVGLLAAEWIVRKMYNMA